MEIKCPPKEIIKSFKNTHGAMSVAEGIALYNICLQAPGGDWVELGSHKGKSSTMIASAFDGKEGMIHLVDPEFTNKEWREEVFSRINGIKGVDEFCLWQDYSTTVLKELNNDISFLFVDSGDHGEEIVQSEKPLYENKIVDGGIIAYHDCGSQFTAVTRCYEQLVSSGNYDPIEIDWTAIFKLVEENGGEGLNNSWHQYPDLGHPPNFIGALRKRERPLYADRV